MNIVIDQLTAFYIILALVGTGICILYLADRIGKSKGKNCSHCRQLPLNQE